MQCPNCKKKIVKFPIKDEQGNMIWKNLFKMDIVSLLIVVAVISIVTGVDIMLQDCKEIVADPEKTCMDLGYKKDYTANTTYADMLKNINLTFAET